VFLCAEYENKVWYGLEWRAFRDSINKNDHVSMFMRFDNSEVISVLSVDGFVELDELKPIEVARLIVERILSNEE
jgi:hypothetical protein